MLGKVDKVVEVVGKVLGALDKMLVGCLEVEVIQSELS